MYKVINSFPSLFMKYMCTIKVFLSTWFDLLLADIKDVINNCFILSGSKSASK